MEINLIAMLSECLIAYRLFKIPFSDFWEYWGWLVLLSLLFIFILLVIVLWKKIQVAARKNEKLTRELMLAIKSGNIAVWRYSIRKNALYGVHGRMFFDEGESFDSFLNRVHPDNQQEYRELFNSMMDGKLKQGEILFRVQADGDYRYIKNSLVAVYKNWKVQSIIGTRIDVTEQISRQLEVNKVADRFSTVFNVATVGLELFDRDGILVEINTAAIDILGIADKSELLAARKILYQHSAYRQYVNPQGDRDKRKKFAFDLEYDLNRVENDYSQKSNRRGVRQLHVEIHPRLDIDGELDCTIVLIYDLTEDIIRNHQYERLYWEINSILRALPVGVAIYQKDGVQKYVNDAYVDVFCVSDRMEFLKRKVNLFDNPALSQYCDRWFLLKEDESIEFEAAFDFSESNLSGYYRTDFNGQKQISVRARAIFNLDGGIDSFLVISNDVTHAHNTLIELKKAKEKAEQSDLLKSVFLANMSHEIRTPLNAIVGFSDIVVGSEKKEDREEYGKIITTNSELLLNLINDILDLSKIEAGYLDFVEAEYDLSEQFQELAITFEMKMPQGVEFECISPYEQVTVFWDRKRMSQVMNNFMSNAIKYTPKGKITMGYEVLDNAIRLFVQDTGIGIPEEKKPFVFNRFEKLDSFAQGTGLGLSICKALVDAKGGEIGFESTVGVGSLFWVWLPTPIMSQKKNSNEDSEKINTNNISLKKRSQMITNVLVVEDNDSNFILIKAMLRGYTVERAENGLVAVEKARLGGYDIIFMDIRMPIMGGLEATRQIRTFDTQTPIVAVTANVFDSDKAEAFAAGCNAFVAKPVQKEIIAKVIRGEYD